MTFPLPAARARSGALASALLVCSAITCACSTYSRTPRLAAGVEIDDRPISASAYAAFLDGALLEAQGELPAALVAFRAARSYDPESVEIQTQIASITCQLDPEQAGVEFEEAIELDKNYESAWRAWALCELQRGKLTRALRLAKQAVASAPASLAATKTAADVHEARSEPTLALRLLVAYVVSFPEDVHAWQALFASARRQGDDLWTLRAGTHLRRIALQSDLAHDRAPLPPRELVRRVLVEAGLSAARDFAVAQGVSSLDLAWLALDAERPADALRQAELLCAADPDNLEAALIALLASHRSAQADAYARSLARLTSATARPLSLRARGVLLEMLHTRAPISELSLPSSEPELPSP